MMNHQHRSVFEQMLFTSLTIIIGQQGTYWIPCLADPGEYTDPYYGHQN